ncbi:hypothetical protein BsWGS_01095 [Bradybaena similaris]
MTKVEERQHNTHPRENLGHPNGIYYCIKHFAAEYENIRSVLDNVQSTSVKKHLSAVADQKDVTGARMSFLRLQIVYNLTAADMIRGGYLGRQGPELGLEDALEIGQVALDGGHVERAIEWLMEALKLDNNREPTAGFNPFPSGVSLTGQIHALLGRAYNQLGNKQKADEMYSRAVSEDPNNAHVKQLEHELKSGPPEDSRPHKQRPFKEEFERLCKLQNKLTRSKFDARLRCSYREVILPYYRFKMELVSVSPYVALFFDVITESEINSMIQFVNDKLARGFVVIDGKNTYVETRTSDLSFVTDKESAIADRLSRRVGAITYLDANHSDMDRFFSSDPFQVVNYGMGGHYDVHLDTFDEEYVQQNQHDFRFNAGGNRLATFLIYLSDVEKGGSTVFPAADVAVSPVKKMALFWYNFEPSGKRDLLTYHAACPVVFGQKWVTNKWIYLYPNMFKRRCGMTETATQLDIDQYMRRGWV